MKSTEFHPVHYDAHGRLRLPLLFWLVLLLQARTWVLFVIAGASREQGTALLNLFYPDTQRARCTGCHRCEISCTNFNDGSVGTFFSRIKIHRNYFFGDNGVGSGGGLYGDLNYTADTCRQCKEPQCMNVCPIGAITWQQKEGCITVDHKRCIGCSACTTACPWMMATVNTESKKSSKCVLCGECANACPTGALKIIEWKDITV